jgi:hypothetical protein
MTNDTSGDAAEHRSGVDRLVTGRAIDLDGRDRRRAVRSRSVDSASSVHDQEHGEQDDGAYQDAGKKISRPEQGPQVIRVDRYRPRRFALRSQLPRKELLRAHM